MLELGVTRVVKITAEKLWPLLGSFSRLPEWFPQIDSFSSEGDTVGSKRNIRIATFDIVQNLLEQDNNRYQTVYQVSSGPGITHETGFVVTISLKPLGDDCEIHWHAKLAELPSIMPTGSESIFIARTQKNYDQALDHLEKVLAL